MKTKAALYIRVSTTHQIDKDSLPFQRSELINYAKYALNIDSYEIFEDAGYSGKNTDRPKYQEMMHRIHKGEFSHLLVWKIDRISRNLKDFTKMYEDLRECKVTFVSKNEQFDTSSAMGEAMLKIILVFAELERKLTAERVFSIMLSRAEKGLWNGATVPIGYVWSEKEKFPVICPDEAETVRYIFNQYEKLASTNRVAHLLNEEVIPTKRGGRWTAKTIQNVLRNPFYIGTYRYNVRTQGKRRLKDPSEWVVVENNHPAIIEKEQFDKVANMLDGNYRGSSFSQRSNIHTHIFSRLLTCGKCGSTLNAGLDSSRSDGYRPSRYTCSNSRFVKNVDGCNNYISDIVLLPFVFSYISNYLQLSDKIDRKHSLKDVERMLLKGPALIDIQSIDRTGLEKTYTSLILGYDSAELEHNSSDSVSDLKLQKLMKNKAKFEKALNRLEDLFLFSEEAMSKKDYLFKKRDLIEQLSSLNSEIESYHKESLKSSIQSKSFISDATDLLLFESFQNSKLVFKRSFLASLDRERVQELIQSVIEVIEVKNKKVHSITFSNGITHKFMYKAENKQKIRTREKLHYRSYYDMVMEFLKENGSASRVEIEKLTGMRRTGALALVNELINEGVLEKRGSSIAIRYFIRI